MTNNINYYYKAKLNDDAELCSFAVTKSSLDTIKKNIDGCTKNGYLDELILEGGKYHRKYEELCKQAYKEALFFLCENTIIICGFDNEKDFELFLEYSANLIKERHADITTSVYSGNMPELLKIAQEIRNQSVSYYFELISKSKVTKVAC